MATADGRLRVVYNGEIYNYPELRRELEDRGCLFQSRSDTEVLLHLYRAEGAGWCGGCGYVRLCAMDVDRRGLLLGRDPLGIKPLYYADDGHTLRVASQVKALLAGGGIDTTPEPAGHVGFFLWGHVPEPYTLFRGIRALPAGSTLWTQCGPGTSAPHRFVDITQELAWAEAERKRNEWQQSDITERFSAAFTDSVRCHMLADVPIGVFLSSGLDSTSIAALAREHAREPLHTVTLGLRNSRARSRTRFRSQKCWLASSGSFSTPSAFPNTTLRLSAPGYARPWTSRALME